MIADVVGREMLYGSDRPVVGPVSWECRVS